MKRHDENQILVDLLNSILRIENENIETTDALGKQEEGTQYSENSALHNADPTPEAEVKASQMLESYGITDEPNRDVDESDEKGMTLLLHALNKGYDEVARWLIKAKKADFNVMDEQKRTALHHAILGRCSLDTIMDYRHVNKVFSFDADLKLPFHYAVEHNNTQAAIALIKMGTPLDEYFHDIKENTELVSSLSILEKYYQEMGHRDLEDFLSGYNSEAKGDKNIGNTTLYLARHRFHENVDPLKEGNIYDIHDGGVYLTRNVDLKLRITTYLLYDVLKSGNTSLLNFIWDDGLVELEEESTTPDSVLRAKTSLLPLHVTAQNGWIQGIKFLINKGAKINDLHASPYDRKYPSNRDTINTTTALHIAAREGHGEMVKLLLEKGADTTIKDSHGYTPFHYSVERSHFEVMKNLLEKNKKLVNTETNVGLTPLQLALSDNLLEVISFLVGQNAEIETQLFKGKTPLDCILEYEGDKYKRTIDAFFEKIEDRKQGILGNYLCKAIREGNEQRVEKLLDSGVDIELKDDQGRTPLLLALYCKQKNIFENLVKAKGANKRAKDNQGHNIAHFAAMCDYKFPKTFLLKYIIKKDIITEVDNDGNTPLHLASERENESVICSLIECMKPKKPLLGINDGYNAFLNAKNKEGKTALHMAVLSKNIDIVQLLLNRNADKEAKDNEGKTALHMAVLSKNIDIVQLLLNRNADKEARDNEGRTPLYLAVSLNREDMVKRLLDKNANPTTEDNQKAKAFHVAIQKGYGPIVSLLWDRNEKTPEDIQRFFHIAVFNDDLETTRICLNCNVDVNINNSEGNTPLHVAVRSNHASIGKLLMSCPSLNMEARTPGGQTALDIALEKRSDWFIVSLWCGSQSDTLKTRVFLRNIVIKKFFDASIENNQNILNIFLDLCPGVIDTMDSLGWTPLNSAVWKEKETAVETLLKKGVNKEIPWRGITPLFLAAEKGNVNIFKMLFNRNDRSARLVHSINGQTPLHVAATYGHHEIVKYLLEEDLENLNVIDKKKRIPLHYASENGHVEVTGILLDKNPESGCVLDINGYSSFYLAMMAGKCNILSLFIEKGLDINCIRFAGTGQNLFHDAIASGNLSMIKLFLNNNADVHVKDGSGLAPIHLAAKGGSIEIVNLLIDWGVDSYVRTQNQNEDTIFHLLIKQGHKDTFMSLMDRYPKCVEMTNNSGFTPIYQAAYYNQHAILEFLFNENPSFYATHSLSSGGTLLHYAADRGNISTINLLTSKGAKMDVKDMNGVLPLHLAAGGGHEEAVKILADLYPEALRVKTNEGKTPIECANQNNHIKVAQILSEKLIAYLENIIQSQNNHIEELSKERWVDSLIQNDSCSTTSHVERLKRQRDLESNEESANKRQHT